MCHISCASTQNKSKTGPTSKGKGKNTNQKQQHNQTQPTKKQPVAKKKTVKSTKSLLDMSLDDQMADEKQALIKEKQKQNTIKQKQAQNTINQKKQAAAAKLLKQKQQGKTTGTKVGMKTMGMALLQRRRMLAQAVKAKGILYDCTTLYLVFLGLLYLHLLQFCFILCLIRSNVFRCWMSLIVGFLCVSFGDLSEEPHKNF